MLYQEPQVPRLPCTTALGRRNPRSTGRICEICSLPRAFLARGGWARWFPAETGPGMSGRQGEWASGLVLVAARIPRRVHVTESAHLPTCAPRVCPFALFVCSAGPTFLLPSLARTETETELEQAEAGQVKAIRSIGEWSSLIDQKPQRSARLLRRSSLLCVFNSGPPKILHNPHLSPVSPSSITTLLSPTRI